MKNYRESLGVLLGNTMQFYDFTLYAFLAPQIKKTFFDFSSVYLSYLIMFGVFACGYLTRPFGALIFGYLGDKKGRSFSLSLTILIATVSTFFIGLIPGYQTLGLFSPALLLFLRLVQGLAVSGEEGNAVVLLFEKYNFRNQKLLGSALLSSVFLGLLLGIIACISTEYFIEHNIIPENYWRLPFLIALPLGLLTAYFRYSWNDTDLFSLARSKNLLVSQPSKYLFKAHKSMVFFSVLIVASYSVTTSTIMVHLPYYLATEIGLTQTDSLSILLCFTILMLVLSLLFAQIFEKISAFNIYKWTTLATILIAPGIFYELNTGNMFGIIAAITIFSILTSLVTSTIFELLVQIFPFGIRCTGVSLSFNLSITLFSSSTPIVLVAFEHQFFSSFAPGLYLSGLLSACLILALTLQSSYQNKFNKNNFFPLATKVTE